MHQRFPILEDVPPVPLVVEDFGAVVFVPQVDAESIPRAAGVAVATAELQWQVFCTKSLEIQVIVCLRLLLQKEQIKLVRPGCHGRGLLKENLVIGLVDVGHEVRLINGVVLIENTATHHVEHGVRKVANVASAVGGQLQPVAGCNQRDQPLRPFFNVVQNVLLQGLH